MSNITAILWKESWRDEYLKWICGFANAQGGKIYIGMRDDGTVIGLSNSKKLLEDIMVKFTALRNAKVSDSKALNVTKDVTKDVTIEMKILVLIKENASITTTEMARLLAVNRRTIQRGLDVLKSTGTIERKGGKRYGYWEVHE